jgi:predicted nucleic acid-binding protein
VRLLIDTSALLALTRKNDRHHAAAVEFVRAHPGRRFVLTELIVGEVATRVRAQASAEQAVALARNLLDSRRYELVFLDAGLLHAALDRMARFSDKRLSLTDCASFELMERLRLEAVFTFDRDFQDCGLRMVP